MRIFDATLVRRPRFSRGRQSPNREIVFAVVENVHCTMVDRNKKLKLRGKLGGKCGRALVLCLCVCVSDS